MGNPVSMMMMMSKQSGQHPGVTSMAAQLTSDLHMHRHTHACAVIHTHTRKYGGWCASSLNHNIRICVVEVATTLS